MTDPERQALEQAVGLLDLTRLEDTLDYLGLASHFMGADWIGPAHFRSGASGLLEALLARLGMDQAGVSEPGAY